jgi:hypothetical protein
MGLMETSAQRGHTIGLVTLALTLSCTTARPRVAHTVAASTASTPGADAPRGPRGLRPVRLAACAPQRGARLPVHTAQGGNEAARRGAQRGLEFVAREAITWQGQHHCYGCHVQAVTFEALTVGRQHQYDVPRAQFDQVLFGLTDINGGHRHTGGLSVGGAPGHLVETARAFGGAAFARYDASLGGELRDDLLAVAAQVLEYQNEDGSVRTTDTRFPVVAGLMQATTQALQTWHQAHARTADERWLAPIRRAEGWMQTQARRLSDDPSATLVDLNYAVMGLREAGAQPGEATLRALADRIRSRQQRDGGWAYRPTETSSNAFATGQALYALRTVGASDGDAVVARGMGWLLENQAQDGGWSHNGSGKAEAMWAVFGLVSLDVLSVDADGVRDGEHTSGLLRVQGRATDNSGAAVEHLDVLIDDVPLARGCGATVEHAVDVSTLESGPHVLDVVATNGRGQTSRRRVEFYTGEHYLTRVGSHFEGNTTALSWRNVAPETVRGTVRLRVYTTRGETGARDREVFHRDEAAQPGPMRATWDGTAADGTALPRGRYVAEVSFHDASGRAVQSVEVPFVHDTPEAQRAAFAEVEGNLQAQGSGSAANTIVELVDDHGRVVQQTATTEQGNYRFRNVDQGNYRVRVRRAGFHAAETRVRAARGSSAPAAAMQMDLAY